MWIWGGLKQGPSTTVVKNPSQEKGGKAIMTEIENPTYKGLKKIKFTVV